MTWAARIGMVRGRQGGGDGAALMAPGFAFGEEQALAEDRGEHAMGGQVAGGNWRRW